MAKTNCINDELRDYIVSVSLREPESLARIREGTARHPCAKMQIPPEEGQLLAMLVRLIGAKRALEIGVFTGYSSTAIALALPPDGTLTAVDRNSDWAFQAERFWDSAGVSEKINFILGDAGEVLSRFIEQGILDYYDFAFIDADKQNYQSYFEKTLMLVRPGGLIVIDNTLWRMSVASSEDTDETAAAIKKFNIALYNDERVEISVLPVSDGVTLVRKK